MVGVTTAASEKPFRTREHRRERRAVHVALRTGGPLPDPRGFGDPWAGEKDGKQFLAAPEPRDLRK